MSGVGGLLFGLFYLSMVVVPILVIVGANWLFRKFLCEACDANPASAQPGETGTTSVNESHPHVRFSWSSLRLALGIGSVLSALLILTVEGSITTTDAGDLRWPLYWAMVFGPAPRLSILGGTAPRGILQSCRPACHHRSDGGWLVLIFFERSRLDCRSSAPRPMFVMKERRGAALSLHGRDIPAPA